MPELSPAHRVLAGVLAAPSVVPHEQALARLDTAALRLREDHFPDPTDRRLWRALLAFRAQAVGVLTAAACRDLAAGLDAGSAALLTETYDALATAGVGLTDADVSWACARLSADRRAVLTRTALRDSAEIAAGQVTEERADGRPGRVWAGADDAREWIAARLAEIEAEAVTAESPAGDVRAEARDIIAAYRAAGAESDRVRPRFGLDLLDDTLGGGLSPGELVMVAAPSGAGKSQVCVQLTYESVFRQGLHVFFATSETVRAVVRNRIVSRASRADAFAELREQVGAPHGLNSADLSRGRLPPGQERLLAAVAASLRTGPDGPGTAGQGSLWLAQIPYGQTVGGLAAAVTARARQRPVDLVVIDYLALLAPDSHLRSGGFRGDQRTDLRQIVLDAKHLATDHAHGAGVPVVSPWQFNRRAQEELIRTQEPDINGLSETAEAVNSADVVIALHEDGTRDRSRFASMRCHLLKNRDGAQLVGDRALSLRVDYATSHFAPRAAAASGFGAGANGSGFGTGAGAGAGAGASDDSLARLLG